MLSLGVPGPRAWECPGGMSCSTVAHMPTLTGGLFLAGRDPSLPLPWTQGPAASRLNTPCVYLASGQCPPRFSRFPQVLYLPLPSPQGQSPLRSQPFPWGREAPHRDPRQRSGKDGPP